MRAWSVVFKQILLSGAVCALLACVMAVMGNPTVVGSESLATKVTFGRCRQCGNPVRVAPNEWCTSCQSCGQITNLEQLQDWNKPQVRTQQREAKSIRWAE